MLCNGSNKAKNGEVVGHLLRIGILLDILDAGMTTKTHPDNGMAMNGSVNYKVMWQERSKLLRRLPIAE
eukprot:52435-Amphidinium_carterae.1